MKKLCAALLRSFRGHHSEKMKGCARGNWDPWEGQQPFRPNPNGARDRIATLRRRLIGADVKPSQAGTLSLWQFLVAKHIIMDWAFYVFQSNCICH